MRVFAALLLDAYRELNSKKLFWVILALSAVFVIAYGSIGFDETGVSMFFGLWHIDNEYMARGSLGAKILYRGIFRSFVVPIWLAWIATILALISTATVFPDFVAGGSIDLVLSKPIGRIRLFFYKYIASLLFVVLQVTLFCVGVFLCMGARLSDWEWKIFLSIPIVVAFYSYLYSVCVLIGVWSRSALTALLLTLLLWFSLYAVNQTEAVLNLVRTQMTLQVEENERQIADLTERQAELSRRGDAGSAPALARIEAEIEIARTQCDERAKLIDHLTPWHGGVRTFQFILPKTSETIALLDRYLKRDDDVNLMDLIQGHVARDSAGGLITTDTSDERLAMERMQEDYEQRPLWYVVGTSLAFEAVVLALACWIFVRRDY